MPFITDLPNTLTCCLLLWWVTPVDLCRLDSAVCNEVVRTQYLSIVRSPLFVVRPLKPTGMTNSNFVKFMVGLIAWVIGRQITTSVVDVDAYFQQPVAERTAYVKRHGSRVRKVTIAATSFSVNYNESVITDLCKYCPNVEVFNCGIFLGPEAAARASITWTKLTHLTVHINNLVAFGDKCQSLVGLTTCGPETGIAESWLKFLATYSPLLRNISTGWKFNNQACKAVAARCPLLEEINLGLAAMKNVNLFLLASGCCKLSTLKLSSRAAVTNAGISAVAQNGALTTVSLSSCNAVSDAALRVIAECCVGLKSLQLYYNPRLSDATLILLGQRCHQLRHIQLQCCSFTSTGLQSLVEGCPLLQELSLFNWPQIGPAIQAAALNCPQLRLFDLRRSQVTGSAVRDVAKRCPLLEEVTLGGRNIGDKTVVEFARRCRNLTQFDVMKSSATADGIRTVVMHCGPLLSDILPPYGINPYSYNYVKPRKPTRGVIQCTSSVCVTELRAWLLERQSSGER
jgi:hypothetical protein